eukprot:maker-scaffold392_size185621-snap-gene-0.25 protein:Tk05916 transcript:maker-scaffold392_size185621-snap-gene-0.25-mRNA-1 annotation:"choline kinase alpha isoform x3"
MDFNLKSLKEGMRATEAEPDVEGPDSAVLSMTSQKKAWQLCHDYLQGAWQMINPEEIVLQQISGGLTNLIFHVSLPKGVKPRHKEPKEVLIRLFGQKYNENDSQTSSKVLENVIFALLSERKLGPRLLGVFKEGRLEEYIHARSMTMEEVRDPYLSRLIAKKMSKIHKLDMPINKESQWLWRTLDKFESQVSSLSLDNVSEKTHSIAEKLLRFDFKHEMDFINAYLGSEDENSNQSGSTLGLPMAERLRDRANSTGSAASLKQTGNPKRGRHLSCQQQSEILYQEVQAFLLAPNLMWSMWSMIQTTNSKIPFGYWSYAHERMEDYLQHKSAILAIPDPVLGLDSFFTFSLESISDITKLGVLYFRMIFKFSSRACVFEGEP